MYAKDHGLLDTDGWKSLKKYARRAKKLNRQLKQYRARRKKFGPKFKFGVQVPFDWHEVHKLQDKSGHTKWIDAEKLEMSQVMDYETFDDHGKGGKPPDGYKKICVHFVYDIKHDLRYKARLVADGHLTNPGSDQSYSGVVSLKTFRISILIEEINGHKAMAGDIQNAYLEVKTKEKVCFVTGPEFGPLEA